MKSDDSKRSYPNTQWKDLHGSMRKTVLSKTLDTLDDSLSRCYSCGTPWAKHKGVSATCGELKRLEKFLVEMLVANESHRNGVQITQQAYSGFKTLAWHWEAQFDDSHPIPPEVVADHLAEHARREVHKAVIAHFKSMQPRNCGD